MNKQALADLDGFYGTQAYHRIAPNFVLSDGALFLAENADCFWLFNEICFSQNFPTIAEDTSLQRLQFWSLHPTENGARLVCERDTDDIVFSKFVGTTDFPFDAVSKARIYVAPTYINGSKYFVAYLPSEH